MLKSSSSLGRGCLSADDICQGTPKELLSHAILGFLHKQGLFVKLLLQCDSDGGVNSVTCTVTAEEVRNQYCRYLWDHGFRQQCEQDDLAAFRRAMNAYHETGKTRPLVYTCVGALPTVAAPIVEKETGSFIGVLLAGQKRVKESRRAARARMRELVRQSAKSEPRMLLRHLVRQYRKLAPASGKKMDHEVLLCQSLADEIGELFAGLARIKDDEAKRVAEAVHAEAVSRRLLVVAEIESFWSTLAEVASEIGDWLSAKYTIVVCRKAPSGQLDPLRQSLDGLGINPRAGPLPDSTPMAEGIWLDNAQIGHWLHSLRVSARAHLWMPLQSEGVCYGGVILSWEHRPPFLEPDKHVQIPERDRLIEIGRLISTAYQKAEARELEKKRNEELERSKHDLQQLAERLNDTVLCLSHQMNRPLVGIRAIASELKRSWKQTSEAERNEDLEIAGAICTQGAIMARGIVRALVAEKSGGFAVRPARIDIATELRRLKHVVHLLGRGRRIRFRVIVEEDARLTMDRDSFLFVIYNLIDNALKYGDSGSEIRLICNLERRTGRYALKVQSKGEKIRPEDAESVFKKFWRGAHAARGDETGLGIGCWAAREHMLRNGGWLEVEVAENLSTFIVYPPVSFSGGGEDA